MENLGQKTDGNMPMPPVKKPIFNVCLRVFLPLLVALTILIMLLTYLFFRKSCNNVSEEDKTVADSDTLIMSMVLQAEEDEQYYEVYELSKTSGYIAFNVPEEHLGEIRCMGGSYYPVAYWYGPCQVMDLSQGFHIIKSVNYNADDLSYQSRLTQIKVYDFSAYKGYTQPMGRGGGIAVAFLWFAELCIAGFLIVIDLIVGMIIFGMNKSAIS